MNRSVVTTLLSTLLVLPPAILADGSPDKHLAELYHLRKDPDELRNLATDPRHGAKRQELERQLAALLAAEGLTPDKDPMPLDEGIKTELPDQRIR